MTASQHPLDRCLTCWEPQLKLFEVYPDKLVYRCGRCGYCCAARYPQEHRGQALRTAGEVAGHCLAVHGEVER